MSPVSKSAETIQYFVSVPTQTKHTLDAFKNGKNPSVYKTAWATLSRGKLSIEESGSVCKCTVFSSQSSGSCFWTNIRDRLQRTSCPPHRVARKDPGEERVRGDSRGWREERLGRIMLAGSLGNQKISCILLESSAARERKTCPTLSTSTAWEQDISGPQSRWEQRFPRSFNLKHLVKNKTKQSNTQSWSMYVCVLGAGIGGWWWRKLSQWEGSILKSLTMEVI